jgi:hypothetical protein
VSDIQQELASLANSRVTPAVLSALDYVVPGEWTNVTSLDEMIRTQLGVVDPVAVAQIRERAVALWQQKPHYQRALTVFRAVDTADKAVAAAVAANTLGNTFSFLGFLDKLTPKPDTAQAIDAALKLAAEVAAFALLRGLPVHSLAEAQAFPAALATYAKADMMRLAAWITIDGMLPLGPEFVQKIVTTVQGVDTSVLTANPLFTAIKGYLPGGSPDEQKGFLVSTLGAGSSYVSQFVAARGLTQAGLASKLGGLVNVADKGMDALAVALDVSTDYFSHTGLQSVARVLVHDAQQSLASGEAVGAAVAAAPADAEGSSWFKTAAMVAGGGAAVTALGAAGVAAAGVAGAAALWNSWGSDDDAEDDKAADENAPIDPELASLDDNALAAREQAIELQARQLLAASGGQMTPQVQQQLMGLRGQRRRMRRARRIRMMMAMRQGRPGLGRMGMGMRGGRGMGRRF